jgi:mannose-6-phosphate isomerase class I
MQLRSVRTYDPLPAYRPAGPLLRGWPASRRGVLAVDGPAAAPWDVVADLVGGIDLRSYRRREPAVLDDPAFECRPTGSLAERLEGLPSLSGPAVVYGPGSACVPHDELWYVDLPKRLHRSDDTRRMHYVDWPLEERHRQALLPHVDWYVDLTRPSEPVAIDGETLRTSLTELGSHPFRTRPVFLPGPWGGQWLRETLGIETHEPNLAWSYELIAPEAGLLLEDCELSFDLLLAQGPRRVLGDAVAARFGASFPIRFDYLDTMRGGNLSIQCHPRTEYAREVFGLDYTQLETYYIVEAAEGAEVFLGLNADADLAAFEEDARAALAGRAFDPARYVQTHTAVQHQIYLIPAGTVHASGAGNVVLEVSATPYLYTLRFYDWLRKNLDGTLRPVHVDHAFSNLDAERSGEAVSRDLIPQPSPVRSGDGWIEFDLGVSSEFFYSVHRLELDRIAHDDTNGRFHVLNLVEGDEVLIHAGGDDYALTYGETIVVPAAVGAYTIEGRGKLVKAFVD